jgi:hypothetical protein
MFGAGIMRTMGQSGKPRIHGHEILKWNLAHASLAGMPGLV